MSGFSEKRVRMAARLFFVMFFLVYMCNADRVYHAVSGKFHVEKLPDTFSLPARGDLPMLFLFDYHPVNKKFKEGIVIRGRLSPFANTSGIAKARVFFRSPDALYEVIGTRYSFLPDVLTGGMDFFVSTAALERGVYTTGFYVRDDEGERFVWLDSVFEKVAGGPVEYRARPVALGPAMASKDVKFALEKIDKEDYGFVLQGWVVLDNAEMEDYNAYIKIRDSKGDVKTFYAPLYTRMDIASLYADIRAANSGFQVLVPEDEGTPGKYSIKVIVKSRKTGEVLESVQTETRNF